MKSRGVWLIALAGAALAGPAFGAVNVRLDQNTLMDLRAPAGTVLIGDPAVVDVSLVTPRRIAILGRGYGETNVIVTDRLGRVIFSRQVEVSPASSNRVSVYRGAQVSNFTCAPACERTPMPGEDQSVYQAAAGPYKDHSSQSVPAPAGPTGPTSATF